MNEQIFTWPLSSKASSGLQNPPLSAFRHQATEMEDSRFTSENQKLVALTEVYLALSLPFQVALRAAEADFSHLGA